MSDGNSQSSNSGGASFDRTAGAQRWGEAGPLQRWKLELGEGYAGAALWQGSVFVMDYDRDRREEALRCLSLEDGREIWRYAYPNPLKRDHGITRTVPERPRATGGGP